ncbi:MAG TPA: hypothetical protein ENJ20_06860, partial [Bacteroidetes bacterium]|nr:hypothetical protein [Bacteroidota bacterium]
MNHLLQRIQQLSPRQQELLADRLGIQQEVFGNKQSSGSARKRLVAYVTTTTDTLDKSRLQDHLKANLPDYMVPPVIVEVQTMPRLPNGKIDHKALEQLEKEPLPATGFAKAKSETEQQLKAIWEEVLAFSPVSTNDNFFEIGGDSILSIQIVARAKEAGLPMSAEHLFKYQTIGRLAAVLDRNSAAKTAGPKIILSKKTTPGHIPPELPFSKKKRENIEAVYPLSPMQEALLFHNLYAKSTRLGFVQVSCRLDGPLDKKIFAEAWQVVTDAHPVLRTSIHWEGLDQPLQVVHRHIEMPLDYEDWSAQNISGTEASLQAALRTDSRRGYDFTKAPVMRARLLRAADGLHYFTWSSHHILLDGWSWSLLFKEVFGQYGALKNKGCAAQMPLRRPYSDFIDWVQGQDMRSAERFWRKTLAGAVRPLYFQKYNWQPDVQTPNGKPAYQTHRFVFSENKTAALQSLARQQRLTLSTLVQAAWALLLHLVSGQKDILFGKTVSGRSVGLSGIGSMLGLFANTLPVRLWIFDNMKLSDWLAYI